MDFCKCLFLCLFVRNLVLWYTALQETWVACEMKDWDTSIFFNLMYLRLIITRWSESFGHLIVTFRVNYTSGPWIIVLYCFGSYKHPILILDVPDSVYVRVKCQFNQYICDMRRLNLLIKKSEKLIFFHRKNKKV